MDKIIFLGTAGDTEVMASQQKASGGIVLQLDGDQFHIDPGPGSLVRAVMAGVSPRNTIAVIATNDSLLRAGDVPAAVSAMTLNGMDKHGILLAARSVLEDLSQKVKGYVEGLVPLAAGNKVGINHVAITAFGEESLSLLITHGDMTIGYTGDTEYSDVLAAAFKGVKLLVVNCPHPASVTEEGVMNLDDVTMLLEQAKPKQAVLTGFGTKLLKGDVKHIARELQKKTKVQVTAATDGMSAELK